MRVQLYNIMRNPVGLASRSKRRAHALLPTEIMCSLIAAFFLAASIVFAPIATAQISSQEVYENPDDHALNLEYAKQQIIKGEMLNAGSALERMLYANPNWHSARLLYAAVLYRLDDQQAALRELDLLEDKELNAEQLAKLETYKTAFQTPPRPIQPGLPARVSADYDSGSSFRSGDTLQGQASLQLRADDNAGNALTDATFGFGNQGDISAVLKGRVRAFAPVSDNITLRGEIDGQIRRHDTFSNADYDVFDASVGISLAEDDTVVALDIDARKLNISGESYLRQIGPRLTVSQKLSDATYTSLSVSSYNQDYDNLSNAPLEENRDGSKLSIQGGILHKINSRNRLRLALAYENKTANIDAFAYDGPVIAAGFDRKLDNDFYVKANARIRRMNFDGNTVINADERKDTRINGRIAVGKALNTEAMNGKSELFQSAAIELGANWIKRNSNIDSNDFENLGADVRLTLGF